MYKHLIILMLLCSGCVSLDKAIGVSTKSESHAAATQQAINKKYPLLVADNCAKEYPVKERTIIKTDTVKTKVTIPGKAIPCPETKHPVTGELYIPEVVCPDVSYYKLHIMEQKETIQENSAALVVANARAGELQLKGMSQDSTITAQQQHIEALEGKTNWWQVGWIAVALIWLGWLAVKFFKPF